MKRTLITIALILFSSKIYAQSTASYGLTVTSLSSSSAGVVTGTPFAIPTGYANIITWTVIADGSALSVNLEGSSDNSTWFTIDSQTTAIGGIRNYGFTALKFMRCSQVSRTGGTNTSCTLAVSRGLVATSVGSITAGRFLANDGTAAAPAYSFLGDTTTGWYRQSTGILTATIIGSDRVGMGSNTIGVQLTSAYPFGWSPNASVGVGASDTTLSRGGAAGKLTLSGTTPMLQLGGTTSSFPALKSLGASGLSVRYADDSAAADFFANNIAVSANVYTSTNGAFGWASGTKSAIRSSADGVIELQNIAGTDFTRLNFGGTTSAFPALKRNGGQILIRLADDSGDGDIIAGGVGGKSAYRIGSSNVLLVSATAPTISSGFGTTPSISGSNGTAAFEITVGSGGVASSGVIGLPAAANGWNCFSTDITTETATAFVTKQTGSSTTTATLTNYTTAGVAGAWTAGDKLRVSCFAY